MCVEAMLEPLTGLNAFWSVSVSDVSSSLSELRWNGSKHNCMVLDQNLRLVEKICLFPLWLKVRSRFRSKAKTVFSFLWWPGRSRRSSVTLSTPSACSTICLTSSNGQGEASQNQSSGFLFLEKCFTYDLHRYTFFIVLYPMGVSGELLTIYAALPYVQKTGLYSITLPNKYNFSFDYHTFLILIMISYIPCTF